jgi:hypothetical protein
MGSFHRWIGVFWGLIRLSIMQGRVATLPYIIFPLFSKNIMPIWSARPYVVKIKQLSIFYEIFLSKYLHIKKICINFDQMVNPYS